MVPNASLPPPHLPLLLPPSETSIRLLVMCMRRESRPGREARSLFLKMPALAEEEEGAGSDREVTGQWEGGGQVAKGAEG